MQPPHSSPNWRNISFSCNSHLSLYLCFSFTAYPAVYTPWSQILSELPRESPHKHTKGTYKRQTELSNGNGAHDLPTESRTALTNAPLCRSSINSVPPFERKDISLQQLSINCERTKHIRQTTQPQLSCSCPARHTENLYVTLQLLGTRFVRLLGEQEERRRLIDWLSCLGTRKWG